MLPTSGNTTQERYRLLVNMHVRVHSARRINNSPAKHPRGASTPIHLPGIPICFDPNHACNMPPNLDPLRPYLHLQKHPKRQINAIHGHLLHPQATNQPPASMPDPGLPKNNHHQPIAILFPKSQRRKQADLALWHCKH